MDYSFDCRNHAVIISVRGRVDESSWVAFGVGLSEAIEKAGEAKVGEVVIDLSLIHI